ncbi:uncharacterized protein LOC129003170 [Macrosteles quadrilineatus]|uniref:uncharacterized protein LOC129003170 n=1 Tax=Macrosteles quadrilineatus TaxID=74068 RepID=UPI0023E25649|nr:uncharacterized protein LOC129003170 [Macrosteles quadrilineatus]
MQRDTVSLLILPLVIWTVSAESVFDGLNVCDNGIINEINNAEKVKAVEHKLPLDLASQLRTLAPYDVLYANYKDDKITKTRWLSTKFEFTRKYTVQGRKIKETKTMDIDWDKLLSEGDNNLKMYVWSFKTDFNVARFVESIVGYYLCKTVGTNNEEGPHIGIAFSYYADGGGGIPHQLLEDAEKMRDAAVGLFKQALEHYTD